MALKDLDVLYQDFPEIFEGQEPQFADDVVIVPVDTPTEFQPEPTAAPSTPDQIEHFGTDLLDEGFTPEIPRPPIVSQEPWGGAPPRDVGSHEAPPDCLAFYLPFHLFAREWWGVYLLFDGVLLLARRIMDISGGIIPSRQAIQAARVFLYYHEAFHHETECFSLRLETTHRKPLYRTVFQDLFKKTLMTDECLEEGLANAHALDKCATATKNNQAIMDALAKIVEASPPGYRRGVEFQRTQFRFVRSEFAERNQEQVLPGGKTLPSSVWLTSPHMFRGIANVKSRVNWLIPKNARFIDRVPLHREYRLHQFTRQLQKVLGARQLAGQGRKHDVWESRDGTTRVQVPRHSSSVATGTQRQIIRRLGFEGGLSEFYRS